MTARTKPRLVKPGTEPSLAEHIAAYKRVTEEQNDRRASILAMGRKAAAAQGRKVLPRFEDIVREFGA